MSVVSDFSSVFTDIANSIRSKYGVESLYKPNEMAAAINNIPTGASPTVINDLVTVNTAFNSPVIIEEGTNTIQSAFVGLTNFNQPMNIPDSVTQMSGAFQNCYALNSPIKLSNNTNQMAGTFNRCKEFNVPIDIPDTVTAMSYAFYGCNNFNQPIHISNNVDTLWNAFFGCDEFNQPLNIVGKPGLNMVYAFANCHALDSPINIGQADSLAYCFTRCTDLNSPVTFGAVNYLNDCFYYARKFNQPITIPAGCKSAFNLLKECNEFNSIVTIEDPANCNCVGLFRSCTGTLRHEIHVGVGGDMSSLLGTTAATSVAGSAITWTTNDVCAWNTRNNIYIYNDR